MASTFKSLGLFNSGPHRFALGPTGEMVVPFSRADPFDPGSTPVGALELVITVTGRLIASSESALWTLRDAIAAQLTHTPQVGALIDHHGRTWTDMSFVRFEPQATSTNPGHTDRARVRSYAYAATFIRFLS